MVSSFLPPPGGDFRLFMEWCWGLVLGLIFRLINFEADVRSTLTPLQIPPQIGLLGFVNPPNIKFCKYPRLNWPLGFRKFTVPRWPFSRFCRPPNWPSGPQKNYPHPKLVISVKNEVPSCQIAPPDWLFGGDPRPPEGPRG